MKKILLLLTLCCLLTGCGPSPAPVSSPEPQGTKPLPTETETPETAPVFKEIQVLPTEAPELSYDAYQVVYNILTDAGSESGQFQGIGPDGSLLWTYETEHFPQAQIEQITPVGQWQDRYYLIEGGTVKALNIADGTVLFSNSEFGGVPCREAMVLDDYGYLYLAGYDGPDFFAMDTEGRTVKKSPISAKHTCGPPESPWRTTVSRCTWKATAWETPAIFPAL